MEINPHFTGYTTTHVYHVSVELMDVNPTTTFSYFVDVDDLQMTMLEHISRLPNLDDFYIYVKLVTTDSYGYQITSDAKVSVNFEAKEHIPILPEPREFYVKDGMFYVEIVEVLYGNSPITLVVESLDDYSIQIFEFITLIKAENRNTSINVLFTNFENEHDLYFPISARVAISFYSKNELPDEQRAENYGETSVMSFRSFIDGLSESGELDYLYDDK
ncbi:hypothetical protein [Nafulsella turpanensis]|uniref:hypothetical protein n=1 Tax=Nafulsella turpanensis TaxID=1265690 RepID=UPI00037A7701|nr:hypothetical protein [Nafulsella turpanensis]